MDEDRKELIEKLELKDALEYKSIRDVFWRMIEKSEFYVNVGVQEERVANYHNGRKDLVLTVIEEIEEANQGAWIQMQLDAKESEE